jgi:hypothetical protein
VLQVLQAEILALDFHRPLAAVLAVVILEQHRTMLSKDMLMKVGRQARKLVDLADLCMAAAHITLEI